jgi:hypothetical protein
MSAQRGKWIARRGQVGAESAIDQVIDGSLHAGEQVRQVADELLADSPYQARQPFSAHEVEELAQGMRGSGFQGVLIVRPHSDAAKRRRGYYQLAYGHDGVLHGGRCARSGASRAWFQSSYVS